MSNTARVCGRSSATARPKPGQYMERPNRSSRDPRRKEGRSAAATGVARNEADDETYLDGGGVEDYEDSTRASVPSEHGATVYDHDAIENAVDFMIVRLRRRKVPFRVVARVLNRSKACVVERYHRLPAPMRSFYEKTGLWGMD